jgi:hypothetical protein
MTRTVMIDLGCFVLGLVMMFLFLIEHQPAWLVAILSFATGAQAVFTIADQRDVLRRRLGLLRDFNRPRP